MHLGFQGRSELWVQMAERTSDHCHCHCIGCCRNICRCTCNGICSVTFVVRHTYRDGWGFLSNNLAVTFEMYIWHLQLQLAFTLTLAVPWFSHIHNFISCGEMCESVGGKYIDEKYIAAQPRAKHRIERSSRSCEFDAPEVFLEAAVREHVSRWSVVWGAATKASLLTSRAVVCSFLFWVFIVPSTLTGNHRMNNECWAFGWRRYVFVTLQAFCADSVKRVRRRQIGDQEVWYVSVSTSCFVFVRLPRVPRQHVLFLYFLWSFFCVVVRWLFVSFLFAFEICWRTHELRTCCATLRFRKPHAFNFEPPLSDSDVSARQSDTPRSLNIGCTCDDPTTPHFILSQLIESWSSRKPR